MMRTRTEVYTQVAQCTMGCRDMEDNGWAVRQILALRNSEGFFVVFEKER